LFAVAVCRWIEGWWPNETSAKVVDLAEAFAEGATTQEELEEASRLAARREVGGSRSAALAEARRYAAAAITFAAGRVTPGLWALQAASTAARHMKMDQLVVSFERLLRDIAGNPFRSISLDARWLSSTVVDLARTLYDERVFERMPILADALMDGGCDSDEILMHCQGPGPHARGCWVVDLLLDKK
jgi:hypothetical protein